MNPPQVLRWTLRGLLFKKAKEHPAENKLEFQNVQNLLHYE